MGAGPGFLLGMGLVERLTRAGHDVQVTTIRANPEAFPAEIGTAFDLQRRLAVAVGIAVGKGERPIVLAGTCNTVVGALSGLGAAGRLPEREPAPGTAECTCTATSTSSILPRAVINRFAAPGGLSRLEVEAVVRTVGAHRRISAVAVTALDPAADPDGRRGPVACALVEAAAIAAEASRAK